jgi:hypothetical protein
MDSTSASVILFILLAGGSYILLYRPFTQRFLYGDADQSPPKAHVECGPEFVRISAIPQDWTKEDVLNGLQAVAPTGILQVQGSNLTLYPSWCGARQTGLLELGKCTELFENTKSGEITWGIEKQYQPATVVINSYFDGLTPLNTPENGILAK